MSGWVWGVNTRFWSTLNSHNVSKISPVGFALYQEVRESASMTNHSIKFLKKHHVGSVHSRGRVTVVRRVLRGRLHLIRVNPYGLLTCPEASALFGWSLRWIYELLRRGDLRAFRRRGHRVIPAREVLRLKEACVGKGLGQPG